ncbi:MAG: hypothetical protein FWE32_10215 [Oscillospiraceae bacterium]|nr:hypothetical protein [Oscillospiraceae bacterium]
MKIIQIIAAPSGMAALYTEHEERDSRIRLDGKTYSKIPIACLALTDTGEIKPMILEDDGTLSVATGFPDFVQMYF